ncbi:MAG TPA: hypothetical protein VGC67_10255 [Cellulomonas sp.]
MSRQVSETEALVLSYGYVHLFWLFQFAYGRRYAVSTLTEQGWATRPMSREEAAASGADKIVTVPWWLRWGLLVGLGCLVLASLIARFTA